MPKIYKFRRFVAVPALSVFGFCSHAICSPSSDTEPEVFQMEEELRELELERDAAQARLEEVRRKLEEEEVAKRLAEEAAMKLAVEAANRPVRHLTYIPLSGLISKQVL